jgi:hypothetical protein
MVESDETGVRVTFISTLLFQLVTGQRGTREKITNDRSIDMPFMLGAFG